MPATAAPVIWARNPACDFCRQEIPRNKGEVFYDAAMKKGPWAGMCVNHFHQYSRGVLGTGFGQKYVCNEDGKFIKVEG